MPEKLGHLELTLCWMADMVAAMAESGNKDYSFSELMKLTGYSDRTIRRYIDLGLVPAPNRQGREARFTREHLGRFWAIACRRREDRWGSPHVASELQDMTLEEALAWAEKRDPLAPSPAAPRAQVAVANVSPPLPPEVAPARELAEPSRWGRFPLLPGMDLVVREGASDVVVRLAREIVEKYGAS
jgi:hypothetical protein